jgi:hypothetical protein
MKPHWLMRQAILSIILKSCIDYILRAKNPFISDLGGAAQVTYMVSYTKPTI